MIPIITGIKKNFHRDLYPSLEYFPSRHKGWQIDLQDLLQTIFLDLHNTSCFRSHAIRSVLSVPCLETNRHCRSPRDATKCSSPFQTDSSCLPVLPGSPPA